VSGQPWLWTPPRPASQTAAVGVLFRSYRRTHGLTQQQLADRLGFDQSYVSKLESGRRAIHDVSTLRHIARALRLPAEEVGLAAGTLDDRGTEAHADGVSERASASQRSWRLVREHLNSNRIEAARAAARLYPESTRIGAGLLTRPGWIWDRPVDVSDIGLRWSDLAAAPTITGSEPEAERGRPLMDDGHPFRSYTRAMRDLDRPKLFENRLSFRLLDVSRDGGISRDGAGQPPTVTGTGTPRLTFGHTTYFDALDVCETVAHETAAAMLRGEVSWPRLPYRRRLGDPFDLSRRVVLPSINTLTIRHDGSSASFVLHRRSAGSVATAGGVYHVIPAGVFQPSGITAGHHHGDFDMWHNIMRELSEELLGNPEHDGSGSTLIEYDRTEPFRSFERARAAGRVRVWFFGVGLDALTLFGEILSVVVVDAEQYDRLFAGLVASNAEGSLVTAGPNRRLSDGIPFTQEAVRRLIDREPLAPSAAACLELAWRHRAALVPGLRVRAAS
jgi:transcriptional regulator with XRE-family HTH domain